MKKEIIGALLSGVVAVSVCSASGKADEGTLPGKNYRELKASEIKSHNDNPWGLVYAGAITANEDGKVNLHAVRYMLHGNEIAANVYTPAGYKDGGTEKYPAVVVAHPNGGVKEQVAGLFAQKLAESGFITVAMDASCQGESGGLPRNTDKPANRIEDIRGAVDFISNYPGVDADRIGLLGICGGGGYSLGAAQTDKRIKAVATLSMFNSGRVRRNGFQDSQLDTIAQRLAEASAARAKENDGEIIYTGDMSGMSDEDAAKLPFALYRDGFVYYLRSHAHPNSTFRYTMSSLIDLMAWDAVDRMDLIDQPLLMVCGSTADTRYMTDDAFARATGTADKELFLIDGAQHIETYHVPEYVEQEQAKFTEFFREKL